MLRLDAGLEMQMSLNRPRMAWIQRSLRWKVVQARPHSVLVHTPLVNGARLLRTGLSTCTTCSAASTTTHLAVDSKPPAGPSKPGDSSTPDNGNTSSKPSRSSMKKSSSSTTGGGGKNSGGGGDPGSPPPPFGGLTPQQMVLAGHAASTGAMGTLAIGCARALDINLFGMFDWGFNWWFVLALLTPLQVANIALLGPDYSSWALPKPPSDEELAALQPDEPVPGVLSFSGKSGLPDAASVAAAAAAAAASASAAASRHDSGAAPRTGSTGSQPQSDRTQEGQQGGVKPRVVLKTAPLAPPPGLPPGAVPMPSSSGEVDDSTSPSSSQPLSTSSRASPNTPVSPEASVDTESDARSSSGASTSGRSPSPSPPPGPGRMVAASSWGKAPPAAPSQNKSWGNRLTERLPTVKTLKDAAFLAQGHYIQNNPTEQLHPAAELVSSSVDSLASEMLLRGILLTTFTGWLCDRAYEGGADDFIALWAPLANLINASVAAHLGTSVAASSATAAAPVVQASAEAIAEAAAINSGMMPLAFVPLDDACRWAAGAAVVLLVSILSARKVARSMRRVSLMSDIRDRILSTRRDQAARDERRARLLGTKASGSSDASTSSSGSSSDAAASTSMSASSESASSQPSSSDSSGSTPAPGDQASSSSTPQSDLKPAPAFKPGFDGPLPPLSGGRPVPPTPPKGMAGSFLPARKPKAQLKAPKVMSEEESRALVEAASQGRLIAISVTDSESDSEGDKAQKKQGGGGDKKGPGRGSGGSSHTGLSGVGVKALNAVAWATALQASRDLMQTATLTSVFVATGGNLAASFAASLVNQVVFSTLQRLGSERMKKRAAALAEELAMFNNKLKQIAEKQKRQKLAAAANAAAETSSSSTTAEAAAEASLPSASGSAEPGAQPPVQAATAVTESVFSTAESPGSSAQTGAADSTPAAPPTAIGRALSTLDLLLPEDPAAQAKQRSQRK